MSQIDRKAAGMLVMAKELDHAGESPGGFWKACWRAWLHLSENLRWVKAPKVVGLFHQPGPWKTHAGVKLLLEAGL
jgi:hypothetical protein